MIRRFFAFSATLLLVLLVGCATPTKMALGNSGETIKPGAAPIFLMTATLKNDYHPSFQPKLLVVNVAKAGASDRADRLNFTMDEKARDEKDTPADGNRYLLRMELHDGDYIIHGFTGTSGVFPIRGFFFAPLHAELKANASGVYYLGHISATVRERQDNEFRAGPVIPLIDQAVAGFSGGTFDVEISDRWDADQAELLAKFPALQTANVRKSILAPFDRVKATKFWAEH